MKRTEGTKRTQGASVTLSNPLGGQRRAGGINRGDRVPYEVLRSLSFLTSFAR